jgi:hypothetical protein
VISMENTACGPVGKAKTWVPSCQSVCNPGCAVLSARNSKMGTPAQF